jgi:hypothetical protein
MKIEAKVSKKEDGYEVSAKLVESNVCFSTFVKEIDFIKNPDIIEKMKTIIIMELKEYLKK